jgi:predicted nucleic acid-binding protein
VIVADASAVVEVLLNTPSGAEIRDLLFASEETIHVPHLLDLEVLQVLRRYARTSGIGNARIERALEIYADMGLNRYPHTALFRRIWELRHNFTAYDAAYIALAEALDAPLLTCNRAFASASGHRAKILLF